MNIIASSIIPMIGVAVFLAALVVGDIIGEAVDKRCSNSNQKEE